MKLIDEFHRLRAIKTDDCIIWPYSTSHYGYGKVTYDGRLHNTHRLALILHTRIDPTGHLAAHGPCNNPRCFNVRHLRWATPAENSADMRRDGTLRQGTGVSTAKLTDDDVRAIRSANGTQQSIAERFGVCQTNVGLIRRGATWKSVA